MISCQRLLYRKKLWQLGCGRMVNLLSNIDPMKRGKISYLTNAEIQKHYLENELSESQIWMENLFHEISYLAINRIKKSKKNFEKEDLIQALYLNIWAAIKSFDPH